MIRSLAYDFKISNYRILFYPLFLKILIGFEYINQFFNLLNTLFYTSQPE